MTGGMDISEINDHLLVGAEPHAGDAREIAARNIQLVISMRAESRPPDVFGEAPLSSLWLRSYDTFFTPIALEHLLKGVEAARQVIADGGRVLVYCQKGRHRSVIMAAAILIASGHSAAEAIALLQKQRQVADPHTWYVRWQIHRFEKHWHKRQHEKLGVN